MKDQHERSLLDVIAAELDAMGLGHADSSGTAKRLLEEAFAVVEADTLQIRRGAA